ncbi:hypothetical protein BSL78_05849 [Apostichopus japonicus]|uniref:F5/8 type C domain-containing protein n=1 Tax=Stichopus japonicus TaxID=307972 RepID=A0A2G8LAB9_STIJA|nr:hypothetical protein BSL78_05849 [Apostichopus japonicus]
MLPQEKKQHNSPHTTKTGIQKMLSTKTPADIGQLEAVQEHLAYKSFHLLIDNPNFAPLIRRDTLGIGWHGVVWSTNPWWSVDLGASYQVGSIQIYNRVDGNLGERLLGAQVLAGTAADPLDNEVIGTIGSTEILDNPIVFTLDKTVTHVSVRLPGDNKLLTLCEVEVYGVPL